jgi:diguanylate cyclase (GGDEF)-like protein
MGVPLTYLTGLLAFTAPDLDYCALPIGRLLSQSASAGAPVAATLASLLSDVPRVPGMPAMPSTPVAFLNRNALIATITPIYASGPVPPGPSARVQALTGWIFAIYQANGILDPVVQGRHGASATLAYVNPSGERTLLASTGAAPHNSLTRSFRLATTGNWVATLSGPASVSGLSARTQGAAIFLCGLALSVLLTLLVRVLSRSRARALQLVEERTVQLRHQALHDALTALPNRDLIFDRAEQMLARARRDGTGAAALFVDLDEFKDINDTFGHGAGDQLLCQAAQRFASALRDTDTVGRLGGDEFVVLVDGALGSVEPEKVAEKLIAALREPFHLGTGGQVLRAVSASIGIAVGIRGSAEELLRDADIALYQAKAVARGNYVVFHPEMHAAIETRLGLEAELREALVDQQFFLVYQPIFVLSDQTMSGAEALLRWRHPVRGVVMPNDFIPTLEATGLIFEVGRFVLEEACRRAAIWARLGHEMMISVNASGRQLDREDFVSMVEQAVVLSGLEPRLLTIEITETTLVRNTVLSAKRLRALKEIGVKVAIDDFGTGYCSLAYLQQFPVDCLKIDRSFVSQMTSSSEGGALVHTIVQMGKDLNLKTLAEGIETQEQLERLQIEDCANGQGYLFARPLESSAIDDLVAATRELTKERG